MELASGCSNAITMVIGLCDQKQKDEFGEPNHSGQRMPAKDVQAEIYTRCMANAR
jgi:hypothetical protein